MAADATIRGVETSVSCTHCGLPVPKGLVEAGSSTQFCCHGCSAAYEVITGCGLDRYYRLRDAVDADRAAATVTGKSYQEFDDEVFTSLYVRDRPDGMAEAELLVEAMHCAACVWLVEKLPQVLPGVSSATVDFRRSTVRLVYNQERVKLSGIAQMLDGLGYPPHPARTGGAQQLRDIEDRRFLVRVGVAGACAGNVMLVSFALYAGMFDKIEPIYEHLFRAVSWIIAMVSLMWPGRVFFKGAWASLRTKTPHLDLPIAIALGVGLLWGSVNVFRGTGEIYFDSLTALVFFLLVGRWVQHRHQRASADSVELMFSLTPSTARRIGLEGEASVVPVEALVPGDTVEVRAGESFPADGMIVRGSSAVDASVLTGESRPEDAGPGDDVAAGTVNLGSPLAVRVAAVGEQTRVGKLMRTVARCSAERAPIVRAADRVAGYFVVIVLSVAAITFGAWLLINPVMAPEHATALLIVACPCALGLATPLAITVAIGRAARAGILIKGGEALEALAKPGLMVLDKTGTVTEGRVQLVDRVGSERALRSAAALEQHIAHPLAQAVYDAAAGMTLPSARGVEHRVGQGVWGAIEGERWAVLSPAAAEAEFGGLSPQLLDAVDRFASDGHTAVVVVGPDGPEAALALGDAVREDSAASIEALRVRGWRVAMLSGDDPRAVRAVSASVGIDQADAHGGVSPEGKAAFIREAMADGGTVVMVGDGVNDAAALASATVGVAVHGGAEASLEAADAYTGRPGLEPVVELVEGARRAMRTIKLAMRCSLGYNTVGSLLAATGLINALVAAVLMPASSLTVLSLAYRSRSFVAKRGDRS
ncbi:MAG: heavy metal translocating P-type ATPase [Planctomycetota bacterium]